jgi:hypothetical protein
MNSSDEFLTVEELAVRLRVKPSWVYGHADSLGAYRLGKYLRFDWGRVRERLSQVSARTDDVGGRSPTTFRNTNKIAGLKRTWNT